MVVLGLGTNLGDKLHFLRSGLQLIKAINNLQIKQVSPLYISDALIPQGAPPSWDKPYLNCALRCETTLSPHELLKSLKEIELKLGRQPGEIWAPRPLDIDILAWDDLILKDDKLHIPHEHLQDRPFALWPLADVAPFWNDAAEYVDRWGSRFSGEAPYHTKQINQRIDTPYMMGILNLSINSFSAPGETNIHNCIKQFEYMVDAGADIVDIGAQATNPNARMISEKEEWLIIENILPALIEKRNALPIRVQLSIDTIHAANAEKALHLGVDIINDQSALNDSHMIDVIKDAQCKIIFMHQLGLPANSKITLRDADHRQNLLGWSHKKIETFIAGGIAYDKIIFDPGIGFGKTASQSFDLIKHAKYFTQLNVPVLIGHSRKSFLQTFTDQQPIDRDIETIALSSHLITQGISYLRVHNVKDHMNFFRLQSALSD